MSEPAPARPVVVTRAEGADGPLTRALRAHGLEVRSWASVSVQPADPVPLAEALKAAGSFDWIVFTSRHAVAAVLVHLPAPPPGVRVAAVGKATAHVLRQRGWPVDLVPEEGSAAGLVAAFGQRWTEADAGTRILYPASSRALPTLAAGLAQLGAHVTQVEAYRTTGASLDVAQCRGAIARREIGAVTFASPSAVNELAQALGAADFRRLLDTAPAVAIGRTTARALSAHGLTPTVAESATFEGLAATTYKLLHAGS